MSLNLCIEFRYSIIVIFNYIGTVISFLFINTQNIILSMEVFVKTPLMRNQDTPFKLVLIIKPLEAVKTFKGM